MENFLGKSIELISTMKSMSNENKNNELEALVKEYINGDESKLFVECLKYICNESNVTLLMNGLASFSNQKGFESSLNKKGKKKKKRSKKTKNSHYDHDDYQSNAVAELRAYNKANTSRYCTSYSSYF